MLGSRLREIVELRVRSLGKAGTFTFDQELTGRDFSQTLLHVAACYLRGSLRRHLFGGATGMVLIGQHVRIHYPQHLFVGKNFIAEDFCEIVALSRQGVRLGDNVTLGSFAIIKPTNYYGKSIGMGLQIGNNSNIGANSYIGCSGHISIGNNVLIGPKVSMHAENHDFADGRRSIREQGVTRAPIVIEDDCWLGSGSTILAGVHIGHGSIVAAGSVVTTDIPALSIVGGVPAKVIRSRDP